MRKKWVFPVRRSSAFCLLHGKVIRIEGGNFTRNICSVRCLDCGSEWKERFESIESIKNGTYACPSCGSIHVVGRKNCTDSYCHCSR